MTPFAHSGVGHDVEATVGGYRIQTLLLEGNITIFS